MPLKTTCDNCGKPLGELPPSALGKRFCSLSCRNAWHLERRRLAFELLKKEEQTHETTEQSDSEPKPQGDSSA